MFCRPWQKPQSVVLCRWREVLIFQRETTELVITLHVCVYTNISHDLDQFTRCNAQSTCYPVTGCCLHFQLFSTSKNNFFAKKKTFDSCHQWKTSRQWWNAGRLGKHSTGQSVDCFVTLSGENEIIFKSIFLLVMMWMSVGRFFFGTGCCCFRGAGHFVRTNHRSGPTFSFYVPVWIFTVVISGRLNRMWCRSKNNGFDFCRLNSHRFTQFGRISLHFNLNFKYLYLTKYSSNWGHT